ncbi:MAG: YgcG family protein, partial [Betaproteobacteria bacterium]
MRAGCLLWAALLALLVAVAAAQVPVPPLSARVTDLTGTLSAQQRQALETRLAEFETRKGAQIAVLIVPTTQPESIEQFARRVID